MNVIRQHKWTQCVSALLVLLFVVTLSPIAAWSADGSAAPTKVLLFPVADNSGSALVGLARLAGGALQIAVAAVPGMDATEFGSGSGLVRRALSDGRILQAQAENGVSDLPEALKVARVLGMDKVLWTQLATVRVANGQPRTAEAVLTGACYDVKANFDERTQQAVAAPVAEKTFNVTGASAGRADYQGADRPLVREAIEAAAARAAAVLGGAVPEVAAPKAEGRGWRGIGYVLGVGLLVALISGQGGESGGPSAEAAAPTPARVEVQPAAIRLFWSAPSPTTLTLLRYQIQRSKDGGSFVGIDQGNARADLVSFPDYDVAAGHTYAYRIRALYTNSAFSEWRSFLAVTFTGA
jgi:hypothetical protein